MTRVCSRSVGQCRPVPHLPEQQHHQRQCADGDRSVQCGRGQLLPVDLSHPGWPERGSDRPRHRADRQPRSSGYLGCRRLAGVLTSAGILVRSLQCLGECDLPAQLRSADGRRRLPLRRSPHDVRLGSAGLRVRGIGLPVPALEGTDCPQLALGPIDASWRMRYVGRFTMGSAASRRKFHAGTCTPGYCTYTALQVWRNRV